jgi:creatinine amidohydrolase/Fe(II)-dependent formamide hydrolase-like protein
MNGRLLREPGQWRRSLQLDQDPSADAAETVAAYPFDHAGEGETSLMLSMCPESVDMGRFDAARRYTMSAATATGETGHRGRDLILTHLWDALGVGKS